MQEATEIDNGVPLPPEPNFPTIRDVMDRWRCSRSLIYNLAAKGEITIVHFGVGQSGVRIVGVPEFEQRRIAEAKARAAERQEA